MSTHALHASPQTQGLTLYHVTVRSDRPLPTLRNDRNAHVRHAVYTDLTIRPLIRLLEMLQLSRGYVAVQIADSRGRTSWCASTQDRKLHPCNETLYAEILARTT